MASLGWWPKRTTTQLSVALHFTGIAAIDKLSDCFKQSDSSKLCHYPTVACLALPPQFVYFCFDRLLTT